MLDIDKELAKAVKHYWKTRAGQKQRQGGKTGMKDAGNRSAVTGGKHADEFVNLIANIVRDAGLSDITIHTTRKTQRTLPGYYRPTKEWDVVVLSGNDLVAAVEVKSQVGSFGNNFNNRVEEALGNATDFWAAYAKAHSSPLRSPGSATCSCSKKIRHRHDPPSASTFPPTRSTKSFSNFPTHGVMRKCANAWCVNVFMMPPASLPPAPRMV